MRAALARDALVDGDAVQPRRDFRLAAKIAEVAEGGDERLLRSVARLVFAAEDAVGERVDAPLPATHDHAERIRIAGKRTLHDLFVARSSRLHARLFRSATRPPRSIRAPQTGALHSLDAARAPLAENITPSRPAPWIFRSG